MIWFDWLLGGVLALWFFATVAANTPGAKRWLAGRDPVGLLPSWPLFVTPRTQDLALLRRDVRSDGSVSEWREVEVAGPRRWHDFLWNPELSPRRAFLALANTMAFRSKLTGGLAQGQGTAAALSEMVTVPYLTILEALDAQSAEGVEAVQFMIASVNGQALTGRFAAPGVARIEFVSEVHKVRGRTA